MHRIGVSVLILNESDEILLVNLESFEERFFAIPGGGVEADETLLEAAYREVNEELGIPREKLNPIGKSIQPIRFLFTHGTKTYDGVTYEGQERHFFGFRLSSEDTEIRPRPGEIRKFEWVPATSLKGYLLFDNQLEETSAKIAEIFPEIPVGSEIHRNQGMS